MTRLVTDDDIELINTGLTCGELLELWLGPSHVSGSLFTTSVVPSAGTWRSLPT
jgi:hypothetical protein